MKILSKYFQLITTTLNFTKREIKTRYVGSLLGSVWVLIYPLAFAVISVLVFSFVFRQSVGETPYFLFVFVGFSSWFWFSQTILYSTRSLISNRDLIANNKFPTESIVFSIACTRTIDYVVNIVMIYILMVIFNQTINLRGFLFIILISLFQLIFQIGISLISSAINVYFRDWQNIMDILLQLFFYATPIIYSLNAIPVQIGKIIQMNLMTQFIVAYREALFQNYVSTVRIILVMTLSIIFFIFGYYFYKKSEHKFAELI